jgi:hypothetical protein
MRAVLFLALAEAKLVAYRTARGYDAPGTAMHHQHRQ